MCKTNETQTLIRSLELFDHPKSWLAIAKNADKEFGEILAEEQEIPIFKPDSEAVKEAINVFLGKVKECRETEVFKGKTHTPNSQKETGQQENTQS